MRAGLHASRRGLWPWLVPGALLAGCVLPPERSLEVKAADTGPSPAAEAGPPTERDLGQAPRPDARPALDARWWSDEPDDGRADPDASAGPPLDAEPPRDAGTGPAADLRVDPADLGLAPIADARTGRPDAATPFADAAQAVPPDAAPRLDGPTTAPDLSMHVSIDAAPPVDGAVEPPGDASVAPDAGPVVACGPDDQEPNQTWEQEVQDGERQPLNVTGLDRLTLEPSDVDWYDFECNPVNLHLSATLSAEPLCESPGGRLCADLLWWTWAYAEGLVDDQPVILVERTCGDLAEGIVLDAGAIGGLAGEAWTSVIVHVTEDPTAPLAAPLPYRIRVTR